MVKLIIAFLAGAWIGILTMCLLSISKEAAKNSGVWLKEKHGTKMEEETYNDKL